MKNVFSLIACLVISIVMFQYRLAYSDLTKGEPPLKITEWDAFGYYIYLPSFFIYHDYKQLSWVPAIDTKYKVTGGNGVQAQKADNGNYAFKYLGGVAIMELPFFLIAHIVAKETGYPPDGFSPPYQYIVSFGIILYCILGIFLLRRILLRYFSDATTAITLLAVCLATNFVDYAAVENGQSHAPIFLLYVLVIYTTIKWHQQPKAIWAALTGYIIGLATIGRPTEAIMLFIPLLWDTHTKEAASKKWQIVKQHKGQIYIAVLFGFIGIAPQLIYWKMATGSFIYDVGSAWDFLTPHFRVLFGWEKGWFIYTPITVFFIVGMFFMKKFPFCKSVIWFCFLNIYIIIAWRDWHYGGTYATRALVQSYPAFSLAFAAFTEHLRNSKWRWLFYAICLYLIPVNLFQITQYRKTIIHYDDMNRRYYGRVYLNTHPSPLDMSLLDNNEILNSENNYDQKVLIDSVYIKPAQFPATSAYTLFQQNIKANAGKIWLKVECAVKAPGCLWQSFINADLKTGDSVKHAKVRLYSPISNNDSVNHYVFYMSVPSYFASANAKVYITSAFNFQCTVYELKVTELEKRE